MPLGGCGGESVHDLPSGENAILPGHDEVMSRVPSLHFTLPHGGANSVFVQAVPSVDR